MRVFLLAVLAWSGLACQCVDVPEREYRCPDGDAACVDAGRLDAGVDAGVDAGRPDAGSDAGLDAGADAGLDAGLSCDGGLCRFDDGGWCTAWSCVSSLWSPSAPSNSVGVRTTELPPGVDAGDVYGWFGGVLLPNGRVLAVAHDSDQFLVFDPRTETVEVLTRTPRSGRRKYAGGVLAPNGRVYVFPFLERRVLEVNVDDGGVREIGPVLASLDGGAPLHVGGIVDAYGTVWTASESYDSLPLFRFDPTNFANAALFPSSGDDAGWGGWWGIVRLPDDRLLLLPKEFDPMTRRLSSSGLIVTPGATANDATFTRLEGYSLEDGGFGLQSGSLTADGTVCGTPAGLVSDVLCVSNDGGVLVPTRYPGPVSAYGFNAAFGDGRVWTTPDSMNQLVRISSDGGVQTASVPSTRYGFLGLVASPQGLVAIPSGAGTGFVVIQPGVGNNGVYDARPLPVLLSPYFNKL